ncbi:mucin-22-like [Gordionus sp. m RMFG-2023]|uniref:mucin-22-like n=1 Tax=Gordionus sp. m RMFG-2023 TaxID=3053472 RepID=UPI0031FD5111
MRKYKSRRISHVAEEQIIWLEGQSLNRYIDSNVRIKFGSTFSQSPLQLCRFVFNNNGNVEAVCLIPYIGGILNEAVQKDIDVSVEEIDSDGKILNNKTYPHSFITYIIGDFELSGDRHKLKVVFKICEENATETVIQTEETTPFGYEFDTKSDSPSQKTTISGSDYTTKPIVLAKETTPFGSGIDSTIEAKSSGESTVSVSDSTTISVIAKETTPVGFDNVTKTVIQTEETTPFGSGLIFSKSKDDPKTFYKNLKALIETYNTLKPESSGESTVSGTDSTTKAGSSGKLTISGSAWRDELCQKVIKSGQYDPKEIFPSIQISDSIPRVQLLRNGNEIIWSIDGEDIYKRKDCHEEEMTCYKGSVSLTTQDQFYMAISILGIDSIINFDSNLRTIQRNSSNTQFSICYYNVKNIEDNIMCTLPTTATNSEIILKQQEDRIIVESNDIQKFYNNSFILRISGDFEVQGTKHKSNMLLHTCQGSTDYTSELTTTSIDSTIEYESSGESNSTTKLVVTAETTHYGSDSTIEVESSGKSTVSISDSTTKLVVAAKETTPFGSESTIGDESSGESTVSISDTTIKPVITAMNTTPFGSGVDSTIESESSGESTVSISDTTTITDVRGNKTTPFGSGWSDQSSEFTTTSPISKDMCNVVKKSGDYNIHQFFNEPKIPDTFPQIIYLERVDDLIIWNVDGNDIFIKKDNSTRISHVAEEQILWLERQSLNRSIDSNNEAVQKDIDVSVEEIDNDGKILNNKTYPHSFITYLIGDFELSGDRHKLKVVFKMCEDETTSDTTTKSFVTSRKTTNYRSENATETVIQTEETTPFGYECDTKSDSPSQKTTISGSDYTTKPVVLAKETTPFGSGTDSTIEAESSGETTDSVSDSTTISVIAKETTPFGFDSTTKVVTSKKTTPTGSGIDSTEVESSGESTVSLSDSTTKVVVTSKETTPSGSGIDSTIEVESSGATVSVSDFTTKLVVTAKETPFGSSWTEQSTKFTTTSTILKDMCDIVKESGNYNIHQFFNEPKIPDSFPQMIYLERDDDRIIWNVDGNDIFMRKYKSSRISHVAEEQILWLERQSLNRSIDSNVIHNIL